MELWELAENFHRIFYGNQRGHGEYRITDTKGTKAKGKAVTVQTPPNLTLWGDHMRGDVGLGVVPITEEDGCYWGCVDVDEYHGLDLEDWSFKLPDPLVLCRSKSGGAHVFLFMRGEPISAQVMRKKLSLVARALGHPNAEIFPKQDTLGPTDIGNWLNMPYFDYETTTRYCIKGGVALSAEEFVHHVGQKSVSAAELVNFDIDPLFVDESDTEFGDAPPCIQYLTANGFPPGSRNIALFSMGVFARKKYPMGWEDKVFEYNQRFMGPGTYTEVAGIIRSLNKKTYQYKCKEVPLCMHCDKDLCSQQTHGIQLNNSDEKSQRPCVLDDVDAPVKCYAPKETSADEPYWVFSIMGKELMVTVDMARSQTNFAREYLKQFHQVILPVKDSRWVTKMNELLSEAEIHELAPDAGPEGQFLGHLEEFCTGKAMARDKDELLIGKPWNEEGRTYFRSASLMRYLDQQRFKAFKENEIWAILKRRGAQHHNFQLKGKHVACWSIGEFSVQDEPFDTEPMAQESPF